MFTRYIHYKVVYENILSLKILENLLIENEDRANPRSTPEKADLEQNLGGGRQFYKGTNN
jgi:hypothetical protein